MQEASSKEVVIVGGGPAGIAAALELASHGIRAVVVDEQQRPGGQILRQPPTGFSIRNWMPGRAYERLKESLHRFESAAVDWRGGCTVAGIATEGDRWLVTVTTPAGIERIPARVVLVAAGSMELAAPLPGWTLPGVMGAGALQTLLKSQHVLPGKRIVLTGTHPLQLLVAEQIVAAGGAVAAVLFPQSRATLLRPYGAGAMVALRHLRLLWPGVRALLGVKAISFNARVERIEGTERVEAVRLEDGSTISCDAVTQCYGFVPQADLLRQAGAAVRRAGVAGGWAAIVDDWQETSVSGLYAAGEATGVAGAARAAVSGKLAGVAIAIRLGRLDVESVRSKVDGLHASLRSLSRFAGLLEAASDPTSCWPPVGSTTPVCRCENVSHEQVTARLAEVGSANALKLLTRCGMGRCQGRICEPAVLRLLAERGTTRDPGFVARFPARPMPIGALIHKP